MAKQEEPLEEGTGHVVIVEDEVESRKVMSLALRKKGYQVEAFGNGAEAIQYIRANGADLDLVITDLRMPGVDGLTVLRETKAVSDSISVLLVTGYASVENAVEAMKLGADDYLTKPIDLFEFRARVSKLIKTIALNKEVQHLHQRLDEKFGFEQIIGRAPSMLRLFDQIRAVAGTNANVLISGESGTGKELIANALHQNSQKRDQRFLPINCAAIPSEILESELFGHEKGSFTGALSRKIGKFEWAANGTIFLDEIGDMSLDLQVKLLRVLEGREFMRVGGSEMIRINSRFIFATNKNLLEAVKEGSFREDLYYRINVVNLTIPPLRTRREDIPLLANHYLAIFNQEHGKAIERIHPDAMEVLRNYNWPGNVRELRNMIENLVIFCNDKEIGKPNLAPELFRESQKPGAFAIPQGMTMHDLEKEAIYQTLDQVGGNKTRAAELLNIGLRTLQRKLKEYEGGSDEGDDDSE
ncbi:MAG: sigma-54-dependent Fis family transcriptional regulator [Acidobacteria bacterium]|nr:sigma-54-dependent Fis family transcriptional regulator [Acidobacteriota bacterium]